MPQIKNEKESQSGCAPLAGIGAKPHIEVSSRQRTKLNIKGTRVKSCTGNTPAMGGCVV